MAITAVPSSAVAQESPARVSSPAENERRELTPLAKPSVIARISPEGRLRVEQEQQQAVALADNAVQAAQNLEGRTNALPQRRTAAEEANAAAYVAALAAQVASAAPAPRPVRNDEQANPAVANVATTPREPQQAVQPAPPAAPARVKTPAAVAAPAQPTPPPRENRDAAPAGATREAAQSAPATPVPAEAVPAAEEAPPEQIPENILDAVTLAQTAKDFVAAFNASQANRALVLERAEPVRQAQVSNVAELRPAPSASAVELNIEAAPRPEAGSARFDTSTFAVGVARVNAAEPQRTSQVDSVAVATANDGNNDTAALLRNEVRNDVRGEPSQPQAGNPAARPVDAAGSERSVQSASQATASPVLGTQSPAQNSLAKQLNVLANLLTPGQ